MNLKRTEKQKLFRSKFDIISRILAYKNLCLVKNNNKYILVNINLGTSSFKS